MRTTARLRASASSAGAAVSPPLARDDAKLLYHLGDRTQEHALLPYCEAEGIAVVGYIPFGRRSGFPPASGAHVLCDVALRYDRSERQVALAFLTRRASLFAIPKSAKIAHVENNATSLDLVLSESDLGLLEEAFPLSPPRRGVSRV